VNIHRFSVSVNCHLADDNLKADKLQDFQEIYDDNGFIMLPDSYTEDGPATRLVIACHGAGGSIRTNDSHIEHLEFSKYLVTNGYAVMDVNGLPEQYCKKYDINMCNNIGSPIAVRSYVKAYHYCMEKFNLKPQVFVFGGSMGGISSTNLVLSGCIPIVAHAAFCPVLDTYNQIFLHPWTGGLPKIALGKIFGFDTDENGEYIYDESKVAGYNPAKSKKAEVYPVPVKFWHCEDDPIVSYEVTKKFVDKIKENGGIAHLRTLSHGGHEPHMVGDFIKNPSGRTTYNGTEIKITPIVEEMYIWFNNFN